MIREFIHDAIDKFDLISIDIFDTFLLRPFLRPTDLFIRLGGNEFADIRIDAERRSRRQLGEYANLDSIYALIPSKYKSLKSKEVELETQVLTVNPELKEVYDLAKQNGKKVVFTSDMYLGKQIIADILKAKGITDYDGLYISCDYGFNKGSGELIRKVIKDFRVRDTRVVHIGDNVNADIRGGFRSCVYTFYYPKISDVFFDENKFAKDFMESPGRLDNASARMFMGALVLAYHLNKCRNGSSMWHRIGCLLSAIMSYSHAVLIRKTCSKLGKDKALLSLRDGYIISKMADFMLKGIDCSCIYGNRNIAIHLAEADPECVKYFKDLNIDADKSLLVEGFSTRKTLQTVLGRFLGKDIATAYFMLKRKESADARSFTLLTEPTDFLIELYEFCNGSPEPATSSIRNNRPAYEPGANNSYERYRSAVYDRLVEAAVDTARLFDSNGVELDPVDLKDYIMYYIEDLSLKDKQFFMNQFKTRATASDKYHMVFCE